MHNTGFPCSIRSIAKVLKFKIGFQDLEKVLNLAKMYIRYWKSWNSKLKINMKYLSRILLKEKQFIVYAVLNNV